MVDMSPPQLSELEQGHVQLPTTGQVRAMSAIYHFWGIRRRAYKFGAFVTLCARVRGSEGQVHKMLQLYIHGYGHEQEHEPHYGIVGAVQACCSEQAGSVRVDNAMQARDKA